MSTFFSVAVLKHALVSDHVGPRGSGFVVGCGLEKPVIGPEVLAAGHRTGKAPYLLALRAEIR